MQLRPNRTLIVAILLAIGTSYYYFDLLLPRSRLLAASNQMTGAYGFGGDFYPIWLTGRALFFHGTNPYTQETTRAIQIGIFGRPLDARRPADPPVEFRAFAYPLYADLLAAPLLPFRFETVRIVLGVLLPAMTAAGLVLWLQAFHMQVSKRTQAVAVILFLVSYPALEGVYAEQVGLLVGAALAMSAASISRGRLFPAGIWLALASVKPQLVWLLVLWLLLWVTSDWARRKGLILGFVLTIVLLVGASQVVLPGWFGGWWRSLVGYSRYTLPPLTELVLGRVLGTVAGLAMLLLAAAICWKTRREPANTGQFSLAVSFVLAITVILEPTGGAVYDHVVLIPAIAWLVFHRGEIFNGSLPMRVLALVAVFAICWQWLVACAVTLVSLFSPLTAGNPAVLVSPTRMAAPSPFVLLALLSFFVVRALRGDAATRGDRLEA
ncbi:MAG TPA: glycosyltransferase 87 family protein [Candidatus Sulfotelmatobacter sp.]